MSWQSTSKLQRLPRRALVAQAQLSSVPTPQQSLSPPLELPTPRSAAVTALQLITATVAGLPTPAPSAIVPRAAPMPTLLRQGRVSSDLLLDWKSCFDSQFVEYDYFIDESWVEGAIPADLRGTLFCVGPGLTNAYGAEVHHPADGDGVVTSLVFDGQGRKAFFRNKFVRTATFTAEQLANRRLSRGMHDRGSSAGGALAGLFNNPLDLRFRSAANAGVLLWGGRLFAMSQGAKAHELNKQTLHTVGEADVIGTALGRAAGALRDLAAGTQIFQPANGGGRERCVLLAAGQSGTDAMVRFVELQHDGVTAVSDTSYRVPNCLARTLQHFLVTDHYYVLLQAPLNLNLEAFGSQYTSGDAAFSECIDFAADRPGLLHLVPRPQTSTSGTRTTARAATAGALVLEVPPMVVASAVNAFELDGGGKLVCDFVAHEGGTPAYSYFRNMHPGYFRGQPKPELIRLTVDIAGGGGTSRTTPVTARVVTQRSCHAAIVAPSQVGRPHHYAYSASSSVDEADAWGPPQVLVKHHIEPDQGAAAASGRLGQYRAGGTNVQVWGPGDHYFVGRPTFIPKPDATQEDEGWLLSVMHNAETRRAELAILDASCLSSGPVCTLLLPHHVPYINATTFSTVAFGPGRGAPRGWTPRQASG